MRLVSVIATLCCCIFFSAQSFAADVIIEFIPFRPAGFSGAQEGHGSILIESKGNDTIQLKNKETVEGTIIKFEGGKYTVSIGQIIRHIDETDIQAINGVSTISTKTAASNDGNSGKIAIYSFPYKTKRRYPWFFSVGNNICDFDGNLYKINSNSIAKIGEHPVPQSFDSSAANSSIDAIHHNNMLFSFSFSKFSIGDSNKIYQGSLPHLMFPLQRVGNFDWHYCLVEDKSFRSSSDWTIDKVDLSSDVYCAKVNVSNADSNYLYTKRESPQKPGLTIDGPVGKVTFDAKSAIMAPLVFDGLKTVPHQFWSHGNSSKNYTHTIFHQNNDGSFCYIIPNKLLSGISKYHWLEVRHENGNYNIDYVREFPVVLSGSGEYEWENAAEEYGFRKDLNQFGLLFGRFSENSKQVCVVASEIRVNKNTLNITQKFKISLYSPSGESVIEFSPKLLISYSHICAVDYDEDGFLEIIVPGLSEAKESKVMVIDLKD